MADQSLDVEIRIGADLTGANQSISAIDQVKGKADELGTSLNQIRAPDKVVDQEWFKELSKPIDDANVSVRELLKGMSGINQAALGARQGLSGIGNVAAGITRAFNSVFHDAQQTVGIWAASIAASFAVGFKGGQLVYNAIITPIWDAIESAKKQFGEFAEIMRLRMAALGNTKVSLAGFKAGIDDALKQIDAAELRLDKLQKDQERKSQIRAATSDARSSALEASRATELAGASGNEEMQRAINQRYDLQIAALKKEEAQLVLQEQIERKMASIDANWKRISEIQERLIPLQQRYETILQASIESGPGMKSVWGKSLIAAKSALDEQTERTGSRVSKWEENIAELTKDLNVLKQQQAKGGSEDVVAGIRTGGDLAKSMASLEAAIRAQAQIVEAARSGVYAASQAGTGLQGAQSGLQNADEKLSKLKEEYSRLKETMDDAGDVYGEGIISIGMKIKDATQEFDKAASGAGDAAASISGKAKDISNASEEVSKAAATASKSFVDSSSRLGHSMASSLDTIASSIEAVNKKMADVAVLSRRADSNAELALQQIKNMR